MRVTGGTAVRATAAGRRVVLLALAVACALAVGASSKGPVVPDANGTIQAQGSGPLPKVLTAASFVITDADTGAVLAARAPHRKLPPASTLKTLTALTLVREIPLDQQITVDPADLKVECTCVGLKPGAQYTLDSLLHALLMRSGNDVANVAASATNTLEAMNALAQELGAVNTHAGTPSGLDAEGQRSTAYDLALILRAGLSDPRFMKYFTATTFQFGPVDGPTQTLQTQNVLHRRKYAGQIGGKDGWTTPAKHTFVGAAKRGDRTIIVTVLGSERTYGDQAIALLDWAFAQQRDVAPVGFLTDETPAARPTPAAAAPKPTVTVTPAPTARARTGSAPKDEPGLPLFAQAGLSLGAVVFTGLALMPGRKPKRRPRQRR